MIAAERRVLEAKLGEERKTLADTAGAHAKKLEELTAELELLKVDPKDRDTKKHEQTIARLEADLEERAKKIAENESLADSWKGRYTTSIRDRMLSAALLEAGSLTSAGAISQATKLLAMDSKAELVSFEEEGASPTVALTLENRRFEGESLKAGVARWLELNPHFAKADGGGAGSKRPNAGGKPLNLDDLTATELIKRGLAE